MTKRTKAKAAKTGRASRTTGPSAARPERRSRDNPPNVDPVTVVLVRHGHAGGRRGPDETEVGLSMRGRRQAARLARRLAGERFDRIYVSTMLRARQTAEPVIAALDGTPVDFREEIAEVHAYHVTAERNYGGRQLRRRLAEERGRVEAFAEGLLREHAPGERVLVVAHGCLIGLLTAVLARLPGKICPRIVSNNTAVSVLRVWPDRRPELVLANCTAHLTPGLRS